MDSSLHERLRGVRMAGTGGVDVYSGVARISGRIWAREVTREGARCRTAVVINHPTSNFLGHYLLERLAGIGVAAVGMCTRYVGNDSALLLENCVLDVDAVVKDLRNDYEHVVLLGNSGGGGLTPLFQSQAEKPTITECPGGGGPDLTKAELEPADGIILLNAHPSRAMLRTLWLDPAIHDETRPFDRDPALDMFEPRNGPPYSAEFIKEYRAAQVRRSETITAWVKEMLADLACRGDGELRDLPFVVHGTTADIRFLDGSIDPSDRPLGTTLWGRPDVANYLPTSLAHFCTLRSWLSQWSLADTHAGAHNMRQVSVPILILHGSADVSVIPTHVQDFVDNITHDDWLRIDLPGGTHYFEGQPELLDTVTASIKRWLDDHGML